MCPPRLDSQGSEAWPRAGADGGGRWIALGNGVAPPSGEGVRVAPPLLGRTTRTRRTGSCPISKFSALQGREGSHQMSDGGVSALSGQSGVRRRLVRGTMPCPVRFLMTTCPSCPDPPAIDALADGSTGSRARGEGVLRIVLGPVHLREP